MAGKKTVVLAKSHRKPAPGARLIGDIDASEIFEITIRVRSRSSEDKAALLRSIESQPLGKRQYLTRQQISERFGADPAELEKVAAYARENGLTVTATSVPRRTVTVKGKAADLVKAFPVQLKKYDSDFGPYRGRVGALEIPEELSGVVEAVFGFDNRRQARPHAILRPANMTPFRVGAKETAFTPLELATVYDFPTDADGSNQSIGIIEFGGGYDTGDLDTYFTSLAITPPQITTVSVDGVSNNPNSSNQDDYDADGEVMLDVEVAGAIAPKAKLVVYFAPFTEQGWVDVLTTAVGDSTNNPSVLSISWGWPEGNDLWTQQAMDAVNQTLQDAALAGVTVCCASGDDGAADGLTDGHAHVDFPAASPYILACGGTTLTASDKKVIEKEVVWNNGPRSSGGGASGGGVSEVTPLPSWQANARVPPSVNTGFKGRGVPDVSGDADPDTGYRIRVHSQDGVAGGTSAVAPLYAALIACWNQKLGSPSGFVNPSLYGAQVARSFHDITQGTNDTTGKTGGYSAGPGWDACTGLGSPDGVKIFAALESQSTAGSPQPVIQAARTGSDS